MFLTSPFIDQAISQACAVCSHKLFWAVKGAIMREEIGLVEWIVSPRGCRATESDESARSGAGRCG